MSEQQRSAGAQEAARCINIGCDCDHCNEWKAKVVDRLAVQPAVAEIQARVRDETERECIAENCRICAANREWPRRLENWGPGRDRVFWDHFKGKRPNAACFAGAIWERRYQRAALEGE